MMLENQFSCSNCGHIIDIGDPFLATATYPARSYMDSDAITPQYLMNQGEVLCQKCAMRRLGSESLAKLKGTIFTPESALKHQATKKVH